VAKFNESYPLDPAAATGGIGIGIIAAYKAQQKYLRKIFYDRFGNVFRRRTHRPSPAPVADLVAAGKTAAVAGGGGGGSGFYVEISTVDGFQGREMDIIIFSCVRTISGSGSSSGGGGSGGIGFMADWQRLNVAITRAKYGLWIVGDIKKLAEGGREWKRLVDHCQRRRFVCSNPILLSLLTPLS
jgi:superfamily I DNA and/or RNA helicase